MVFFLWRDFENFLFTVCIWKEMKNSSDFGGAEKWNEILQGRVTNHTAWDLTLSFLYDIDTSSDVTQFNCSEG